MAPEEPGRNRREEGNTGVLRYQWWRREAIDLAVDDGNGVDLSSDDARVVAPADLV
jgi:hypothetical protein